MPVPQQRNANQPLPLAGGVAVRELTPEQQAEEAADKPPVVLKSAPPWLVSLIVHIFILIAAALFFIAQVGKDQVDIFVMNQYAEEEGGYSSADQNLFNSDN